MVVLAAGDAGLEGVRSKEQIGSIHSVEELKDGRVLVGADEGLFVLAPGATHPELAAPRDLSAFSIAKTGDFYTLRIRELKDGRVLVGALEGLFMLAPGAARLERAAPRELTGRIRRIQELKDGRVLVGATEGLFVPPRFKFCLRANS